MFLIYLINYKNQLSLELLLQILKLFIEVFQLE
jgi:hypothetical protein